ncbi:uncharacterized protein si:ch211-114l13.9 [Pygocentrus nattereri]|uniref:uncharacterized protein si:ch211-114l13.9 n=1 Tax=Pygocentrus nattereri TaxID=42514 RepID=UPI001890E9AC|nr:uncharacterized protein si:ch211-114l13.9 [Pygocentrus nattereri]XP_037399040.1 uncharacterized protein si:ch211-114l13.9 [Pygocentrus nattereri]
MTNVSTVLVNHLYELKEEEFERFKWYMTKDVAIGFDPIPKGKLEKKTRENVVDLMKSNYMSDTGKIAVKILREMQQNNLAEQLEEKLAKVQEKTDQADGVVSCPAQAPVAAVGPAAPGAPGVHQTITADSSSKVTAPVLCGSQFSGPVNLTFN